MATTTNNHLGKEPITSSGGNEYDFDELDASEIHEGTSDINKGESKVDKSQNSDQINSVVKQCLEPKKAVLPENESDLRSEENLNLPTEITENLTAEVTSEVTTKVSMEVTTETDMEVTREATSEVSELPESDLVGLVPNVKYVNCVQSNNTEQTAVDQEPKVDEVITGPHTSLTGNRKEDNDQTQNDQILIKESEKKEEFIDDWFVPASDDDESDDKIRTYEPSPEKIMELYKRIDEAGILELNWKCPGRRVPEDEEQKLQDIQENSYLNKDEEMVDESMEEDANEFDFAIDSTIDTVTPRRTPAIEHKGSSRKRVARMDKVIDDIMRYQRIDEAMVKEGDEKPSAPTLDITPQRPLGKFHIRRDIDA